MWSRNQVFDLKIVACLLIVLAPECLLAQGSSPESSLETALKALQDGNVHEARELLEAVVDTWPGYRRAYYHLGRLAFDRGELNEANRLLEMGAEGDFPRAFSAWYLLGRTRILQRDFADAVEALDEALDRAPSFSAALTERGRARLFMGEVESGLADLLAALDSADPSRQAAILASQLLMGLGRDEEAAAVAEALADRSEGEAHWARRAEWLRLALDPNPVSQRELRKAVEESPGAGDLYWALAAIDRARDPARSSLLLRIALDHDSENPVSLLALEQLASEGASTNLPVAMPHLRSALTRSRKLWEEGRHEEGRQIAEGMLEHRPGLVPAHLLIAMDAERLGDLWRAAWIYERLLEWLGPIPSIGQDLAEVAQTMGAHELATCGLEVARDGDPEDGALYYLLGSIEADKGDTERAIEAYEQALVLGYEDMRIWLRLGELHFEQMNISQSITAYERAMALDPAAAEAVRSFALSSLTTDQYQSLREILEAHIQQHPENINTLYSLGVMSLRDDRLEEAERYFRRLAEIAPDHRQVHYNLGQILLRQGNTVAGQVEMEKFRQIKTAEDLDWEAHNQAHFRRVKARKLVEESHLEEAIDLYVQSVGDGTAELSDYLELANANLAAGHSADALLGFEGVLETFPYNRSALQGLTAAAIRTGARQKAEDASRKLEILEWTCKMTSSDRKGEA